MDLEAIQALHQGVKEQIGKIVVGQDDTVALMLVSLLARGHIILEGVPGTAKTLLAQCFGATLSLEFGRIQFTPDLMPGDVIGTNLFNFQTNQFSLTKGPIFTQILLADEINRTPAKTQAALLQAMQEQAVTIDDKTYALDDGFMVIATENPIEQLGTYPLPEAQLDRFLFKLIIDYPSREDELAIVARHGQRPVTGRIEDFGITALAGLEELAVIREFVGAIKLNREVVEYIVDIVRSTREHGGLQYGASPRAASVLAAAARAHAALDGRDYVIPDDVKTLAVHALRHRVVLAPSTEIEGDSAQQIIEQICDSTAAPR
ncbi:MAG: MoxR family ATPase [Alphaproteobacteria bacterium]|jgi:MoxR-like ATPase|nr:MoxR family ATPase [Alphaproteobacteria bacterium]